MKVHAAVNPNDFRCPGKGPSLKAKWCYKIARSRGPKKGFVVQVNTRELLVVGYLAEGCVRITGTGSGRKAKVFASAKVADQAAQKCILISRKPRA